MSVAKPDLGCAHHDRAAATNGCACARIATRAGALTARAAVCARTNVLRSSR